MTCRESRNLMALYRELSDEESARLRAHVRSCNSCSADFASTTRMESLVEALRSVEPTMVNSETLTSEILSALSRHPRPGTQPLFDFVLRLVETRAFRISYACVIVISAGLFSVSEFRSFAGLRELEERMSRQGTSNSTISFTVQRESIAAILPPSIIQQLFPGGQQVVTVDRPALRQGFERTEQAVFRSLRLPPELTNGRHLHEAVTLLTKSLIPKISFSERSSDQP